MKWEELQPALLDYEIMRKIDKDIRNILIGKYGPDLGTSYYHHLALRRVVPNCAKKSDNLEEFTECLKREKPSILTPRFRKIILPKFKEAVKLWKEKRIMVELPRPSLEEIREWERKAFLKELREL